MSRTPSTSPTRRMLAAAVFVTAAIVLLLPAALAATEVHHVAGFGWPGPYESTIAASQAADSLSKIQATAAFAAIVLIGATIGAGFAARSAGQRVWLVCLVGAAGTLAGVGVGAALLSL